VRQRTGIFGDAVYWGEIWTPGANDATTFAVDRPIELADHAVPAGKYSLWFVVDSTSTWEAILDPEFDVYHEDRPEPRPGQIRFPVDVVTGGMTEVLTFTFPVVTARGGTLRFEWADRSVSMPIAVEPSLPPEVSAEDAAPFVGTWQVRWPDAESAWDDTDLDTEMIIRHEDDVLVAHWDPIFWGSAKLIWLIPITSEWFTPGIIYGGEVFDVFREFTFEFTLENGRAIRFELRLPSDDVVLIGERRN
jgi:hypothetical protein